MPAYKPLKDRFWDKVEPTGFCWNWTAAKYSNGYGCIGADRDDARKTRLAHTVAYELLVGEIPDGMVLDHLCHNRACVNPDHLEPVTMTVNTNRSPTARSRKTHCPSGHEYTDENTYRYGGSRQCRICRDIHRGRQPSNPHHVPKEEEIPF